MRRSQLNLDLAQAPQDRRRVCRMLAEGIQVEPGRGLRTQATDGMKAGSLSNSPEPPTGSILR